MLSLFLLKYLRVNFVSLLCFSFIEKERKGVSVLKVFSRVVNTAVILMSPTAEETDRRERGGGYILIFATVCVFVIYIWFCLI